MKTKILGLLLCFSVSCAAQTETKTDFLASAGQLATEAKEASVLSGKDGWLFLSAELRHLGVGPFWGEAAAAVTKASKPDYADPLVAILDVKKQVDALGVKFFLLPVPPKAVIYPDKLISGQAVARYDEQHQAFYKLLREQGVEVLDYSDALLELRKEEKAYCEQDSHWSPAACQLIAGKLAALIKKESWYSDMEKQAFVLTGKEIKIKGDLYNFLPADKQQGLVPEKLHLAEVRNAADSFVQSDETSPVLLLGDSHTLVFNAGGDMHAQGGGLADHLAYELGFPVDLVGVRGSGAGPARINLYRKAKSNPAYWTQKKVLIWCFSAREFTEGTGMAWRVMPLK